MRMLNLVVWVSRVKKPAPLRACLHGGGESQEGGGRWGKPPVHIISHFNFMIGGVTPCMLPQLSGDPISL